MERPVIISTEGVGWARFARASRDSLLGALRATSLSGPLGSNHAALFFEANRDKALSEVHRRDMLGEGWIWIILAVTGSISILISLTPYGVWAAMAYSTLPITVRMFVSRWNWSDRGSQA